MRWGSHLREEVEVEGAGHVAAVAGCAGGVVERTQQARFDPDVVERLALVPDVVARGHDVDPGVENLLAHLARDAEAGGGVLRVGDDEVDLVIRAQRGHAAADEVASRAADDVADEEESGHDGQAPVTAMRMERPRRSTILGIEMRSSPCRSVAVARLTSQGLVNIAMLTAVSAFLGQCWNISGGFGGLTSFGHAIFFGVGAYAAGVMAANGWHEPLSEVLVAAVIAAGVGFGRTDHQGLLLRRAVRPFGPERQLGDDMEPGSLAGQCRPPAIAVLGRDRQHRDGGLAGGNIAQCLCGGFVRAHRGQGAEMLPSDGRQTGAADGDLDGITRASALCGLTEEP